MPRPLTRRERSIAAKYKRFRSTQDRASALYAEADRIAFELAQKLGGHGKVMRISEEGKALQVIDNYQAAIEHPKREKGEMPKAWAHGSVRQFEFKETHVPAE